MSGDAFENKKYESQAEWLEDMHGDAAAEAQRKFYYSHIMNTSADPLKTPEFGSSVASKAAGVQRATNNSQSKQLEIMSMESDFNEWFKNQSFGLIPKSWVKNIVRKAFKAGRGWL